MTLRWQDWPHGLAVLAGLILRDAVRPAPAALSTEERLGMLPTGDLPLCEPVTIRWDKHQIPFIEAATERDLAVGLGAAHAHLRLGQIEITRRIALGRVAEMVGPLGIAADQAIRLLQLDRAVPAMIAGLPDETRLWVDGFLDGLNHVIANARPPREFDLLGLQPEPWTIADLMTVLRLGSADISWLIWARLLRVRRRLPVGEWRVLWRRLHAAGAPPAPDRTGLASLLRAGSNSAAVSGARTESGAALIASDPHLPHGLPSSWLIVGLRGPVTQCVGLTMPGLPFVALGRNADIGWGGTSLHAQSSDLFDVSDIPPSDIETRHATLKVRGGADRTVALRHTAHGPIVSDGILFPSREPLSMRWMGHRASDELTAMLAVARAGDWTGFRTALDGFGVSGLNMIFAGRDGTVGHLLAAHMPRRPHAIPDDIPLPLDAAEAWSRRVTAADQPMRTSPEHALVVSANQAPARGPAPVGYFFSPPDRAQRIEALLDRPAPVDMAAMRTMQRDVRAQRSLALRDLLLAHWPGSGDGPHRRGLHDALAGWDGRYDADSVGALAFELLLGGIVRRLGQARLRRAHEAVWMTQPLLQEELAALPPGRLAWLVARAIVPAARRLQRHGDWGSLHRIRLSHPFGRLPLVGHRYRRPAFASGGSNDTVQKSVHRLTDRPHLSGFGACARHVSDLSDPDANEIVLLGGQDGWFGSENFDDLTTLWRAGRAVRVPLRPGSVAATFLHVTMLHPPAQPQS